MSILAWVLLRQIPGQSAVLSLLCRAALLRRFAVLLPLLPLLLGVHYCRAFWPDSLASLVGPGLPLR